MTGEIAEAEPFASEPVELVQLAILELQASGGYDVDRIERAIHRLVAAKTYLRSFVRCGRCRGPLAWSQTAGWWHIGPTLCTWGRPWAQVIGDPPGEAVP